MPEVRHWTNETGATHVVDDWWESDHPKFNATIRTACGLEYHVHEPGFTFDPDKSSLEQANDPRHGGTYYCQNCPWDEVMGR